MPFDLDFNVGIGSRGGEAANMRSISSCLISSCSLNSSKFIRFPASEAKEAASRDPADSLEYRFVDSPDAFLGTFLGEGNGPLLWLVEWNEIGPRSS